MTYAIVTAILVLALVAVVIALIVDTDEAPAEEVIQIQLPSQPLPYFDAGPSIPAPPYVVNPEESQAREIRVVDVPEDPDRDARPFGV
jgi:hypothetical protein